MSPATETRWHPVCPLEQILPDSGVAVRLRGRRGDACADHPGPGRSRHACVSGSRVAVFRLADGRVLAVDHVDPFTGVPVLARGIVGDHDGIPTVASPLHKQRFSLLDGRCLDEPAVRIATHPTRVVDGIVHVAGA